MRFYFIFLSLLLCSCESKINPSELGEDEKKCFHLSNEADVYLKGLPAYFDEVELTKDVFLLELGKSKKNFEKYSNVFFDCQFFILNKKGNINDSYVKKIAEIKNKVDSALSIIEVYEAKLKNSSEEFDLSGFSDRLIKMLDIES